jgi:DNA-3-methyladenine glycosylase II
MQILSSRDTELKSKVGLSSKKIEYLKDLSSRIGDGRLNLDILPSMTDEEVISTLQQVKGIGRWTAEMFLIFCLGRQDVLPVTTKRWLHSHFQVSEVTARWQQQ